MRQTHHLNTKHPVGCAKRSAAHHSRIKTPIRYGTSNQLSKILTKLKSLFTLISISLLVSACLLGPDYQKPETPLPTDWQTLPAQTNPDTATLEQSWWQQYQDPILNALINKASTSNLDLKMAETRIAQARASRSSAYAALFPTGDMLGSATRQANQIGFPSSAPANLTSAIKQPFNIFKTGFDASWELDLFGGHRREAESASAELEAMSLTHEDLMLSIRAEVARTYLEIRQYQAQLQLSQQIIDAIQQYTKISQQMFTAGSSSAINTETAQARLQQAQAQIPLYSNLLAQAEFSLDVLLGEPPGTAHGLVYPASALPVIQQALILSAPAAVIAQRPDIRSAERKLAAATAQQGVAVAKFFPDISLTGFIGLFNTNAANLLNVSSKSWNMGANVFWPILSYGSLSANQDAANAKQREALFKYQATILNALSDVERAVTAYTEQQKQTQNAEKTALANQNLYALADGRYQAGLASLLAVLDAQAKNLESQQQLLAAKALREMDLIAVYKSLGGD